MIPILGKLFMIIVFTMVASLLFKLAAKLAEAFSNLMDERNHFIAWMCFLLFVVNAIIILAVFSFLWWLIA